MFGEGAVNRDNASCTLPTPSGVWLNWLEHRTVAPKVMGSSPITLAIRPIDPEFTLYPPIGGGLPAPNIMQDSTLRHENTLGTFQIRANSSMCAHTNFDTMHIWKQRTPHDVTRTKSH